MFPPCISAASRCVRPLPHHHATFAVYPAACPPCRVAELVFWAIVRSLRSPKEESQPPVRAKVGATWVPNRKSESIMKAELVEAASKVITSPQILVNMVSRRVRQLTLGHRPLVVCAPGLGTADIALTEIANGKLTFESTLGENGTTEPPARIVLFPVVAESKKAVLKKKAA